MLDSESVFEALENLHVEIWKSALDVGCSSFFFGRSKGSDVTSRDKQRLLNPVLSGDAGCWIDIF